MSSRVEHILREHLPAIIDAGEDGAFLRNVLADRMEEADEELHAEFWRLAAKMCWTTTPRPTYPRNAAFRPDCTHGFLTVSPGIGPPNWLTSTFRPLTFPEIPNP